MRILAVLLALNVVISAAPQTSLPAGPYSVGFRAVYQMDTARAYDRDYAVAGGGAVKKPRPIFIAIWYPAAANNGKAMVYRDYLRAIDADAAAGDFGRRLRLFTRDAACNYMLGKDVAALDKKERAAWDAFLASAVGARGDASPAPGRFPVVIHHPGLGGTYEDNSVLIENLASRGYVVISSAYEPADAESLEINGNLYTSLDDLSFMARFAGTLPFADTSHLAAMGHSYGAQAVLAWRAQPGSPVDATVVLDSTVDYDGIENDVRKNLRGMLNRNTKAATPLLFAADARRKPKFDAFDAYLSFADRYEVGVDGQEHNDFVSQGVLGKSIASDATAGEAWRKYDMVGTRVIQFLDASLKGDTAAAAALRQSGGVRYKSAKVSPPTARQLARLVEQQGFDSARKSLAGVAGIDADTFDEAATGLTEAGRKADSARVIVWGLEVAPGSAVLHADMGDVYEEAHDAAKAKAEYGKALQVLDGDKSLTDAARAKFRELLAQKLR